MRKQKIIGKWLVQAGIMSAMVALLSGCGKEIEVTINEQGVLSVLTVDAGMTVEDILGEAQVTVGEKDKVDPEMSEKIQNSQEIVISRYAKVVVNYGTESKEVECLDGTVEDAIREAGFTLGDNDSAGVPLDTRLEDGMQIDITSQKEVTLKVDGQKNAVTTQAATIQELLQEQGITLGENDVVSPELSEKLETGAKVVVKRVEIKEETVTESIPFETEKEYSDKMYSGETKVQTEGVQGEKEVVYSVKYVDGKEKKREVVSEQETKAPVTEVVTYGTKKAEEKTEKATDNTPSVGDKKGGKTVTSKQKVEDCDGSGHGYYIIRYDDGSEEYIDY